MSSPLVSTSDLAAWLAAPDLRVVDASWFMDGRDGRAGWLDARIPGAVFFDIDAVSDCSTPLPHMLPAPEAFAGAMADLGLSAEDHIVVYDQQGLFSAARAWWSLRTMGAERVSVLDGGLPKWVREGRPVERGDSSAARSHFRTRYRPELVCDLAGVQAALVAGEQVVDARPAARFRGEAPEPRGGLRRGHMPGARNLPFTELLNPDGTLKEPSLLAQAFASADVDPARRVVATCGSGVTAAIVALAVARLGGEAAIYDGSWAEWGGRPDTTVATGP